MNNPEEFRKNLTAVLMTGTSLFFLDNVHKKVDSASLALATTSELWRDRVLGASKSVTLKILCSWVISGNNVVLSEELARRAVLIRFDANVERPTDRKDFRHPDLLAYIRANRGELIWAVLTLIQAWIAAGRPSGTSILASYEPWSRVMGGILQVAGIEGFLENRDELKEVSADDEPPMKAFIKLWFKQFGSKRVPMSKPGADTTTLSEPASLLELYNLYSHEIDLGFNAHRTDAWPSMLGSAITKFKDRVFDIRIDDGSNFRVKLRSDRTSAGAMKWLEFVKK